MGTSSAVRTNGPELNGAITSRIDMETRVTKDDHQALRLWLRLLSCTVRLENHVRIKLRQDFYTTLSRFDFMAQLERYPDGLRMNELSKRLMVTGGNVTGLTDQLEREGSVFRRLDPGDRRAITVKLTEHGLQRFRQMATRHEQWIVELLSGLNQEEKQTMLRLLRKLKLQLSALPVSGITTAPEPSRPRKKR
jgi:DNA-binding MarR family transcriptional regulator